MACMLGTAAAGCIAVIVLRSAMLVSSVTTAGLSVLVLRVRFDTVMVAFAEAQNGGDGSRHALQREQEHESKQR
jgi:hypothetical protein